MFKRCLATAHAQDTFVLPFGVGGLCLLWGLDRRELGLVGQAEERKADCKERGCGELLHRSCLPAGEAVDRRSGLGCRLWSLG